MNISHRVSLYKEQSIVLSTFLFVCYVVCRMSYVFMDLSKGFDCIPHDLLIAKFAAYDFDGKVLNYTCSYLKHQKQCLKINNTKSVFIDVVFHRDPLQARNYLISF